MNRMERALYSPASLLTLLISLDLLFALLYVVLNLVDLPSLRLLKHLFDLNRDLSIPSWFSSLQLFLAGLILLFTYRENRRLQEVSPALLLAGAFLFIFLSADEGAGIHEKITLLLIDLQWDMLLFKGNHGGWILPYFLLGAFGLLAASRQLRDLWGRFRSEALTAVCGSLIYIAGAVGFEVFYYLYLEEGQKMYKLEILLEESCEMAGVSLLVYAFFRIYRKISP